MSYETITQSTRDGALRDRITAAIGKETFANPAFGDTAAGANVKQYGPTSILEQLIWPCCIDFEADYAYAVESGNPNPGGDPGVIGDDEIGSAVQVHWPPDPEPAP